METNVAGLSQDGKTIRDSRENVTVTVRLQQQAYSPFISLKCKHFGVVLNYRDNAN